MKDEQLVDMFRAYLNSEIRSVTQVDALKPGTYQRISNLGQLYHVSDTVTDGNVQYARAQC